MADVSVRAATARDVPEIARVQLDTWRTAYAQLVPPAVLAEATPERAAAAWLAAVSTPPSPRHRVLVALEQDWVVGFVAFAPGSPDEPGAEIVTLLVEPRWGRRGHGSRLLAAAVDLLRSDGTDRVLAWLPEGDQASARFYLSAGWAPDGVVRTLESSGEILREVRYHASLADADPGSPQPGEEPHSVQ